MSAKPSLRLDGELNSPAAKRDYNERLFTEVAPRYDLITRLLSFGCDGFWKRKLVSLLPKLPSPRCVDVACGTGDFVRLLRERYAEADITGVDLTESMLERARARLATANVRFVKGDMSRLEAADGTVDVLTGGYALRNAPDLAVFLAEANRVLTLDGVAAFLDFRRPDSKVLAGLHFFLIKMWGGFWGYLFHGDPHVYGYIAESLMRYPPEAQLHELFRRQGFRLEHTRRPFFGMVEIIVARKITEAGR